MKEKKVPRPLALCTRPIPCIIARRDAATRFFVFSPKITSFLEEAKTLKYAAVDKKPQRMNKYNQDVRLKRKNMNETRTFTKKIEESKIYSGQGSNPGGVASRAPPERKPEEPSAAPPSADVPILGTPACDLS